MEVIADKLVQARKTYRCDACDAWLRNSYYDEQVNNDDRLIIDAAKADGWKILKGQVYLRSVGKYDGKFVTMRMRPGMCSLVTRLDLWDEE